VTGQRAVQLAQRGRLPARGVQRHRMHVRETRIVRREARRGRELLERGGQLLPAHERQAERVAQRRVLARDAQAVAQHALRLVVAALHALQVGQVHVRGDERRIQRERGLEVRLRFGEPALPCAEVAERRARLRAVRVVALHGLELRGRALERGTLLGRGRGLRVGEPLGRVDPDRPYRILQQRREQFETLRRRQHRQRGDRAATHQRAWIAERGARRVHAAADRMVAERLERRRARDRRRG
jgi:hypothetical protein